MGLIVLHCLFSMKHCKAENRAWGRGYVNLIRIFCVFSMLFLVSHVYLLYVCSAEELHSYLGETEGLILVDKYVSELPLVRITVTFPCSCVLFK